MSDREIEIVQDLLDRILGFGEAMGNACDVCAELDCLLSFAEASRTYDYRRPRMVEDNVIDIKGGRSVHPMSVLNQILIRSRSHPLQEQVLDTFVPNDTRVAGGIAIGSAPTKRYGPAECTSDGDEDAWNSVVLCTGANACGKVNLLD